MNLIDYIFALLFEGGASMKLVPAINFTIILLLVFLVVMSTFVVELAFIHIAIMSFLSIGLLLSVNW